MRNIEQLEVSDNRILSQLVGIGDKNLTKLERKFGLEIRLQGNKITITGPALEASYAKNVLQYLHDELVKGIEIEDSEVEFAINNAQNVGAINRDNSIFTKKKIIFPRTAGQNEYINNLRSKDLVFGIGPAGSGKTYLAVAIGVSMLISGKIDKLILSRPAVEAGERLGFLPGDMREKVDPYLRPIYDALNDMLPSDQIEKKMINGEIEIAPLAFMRGRTLSNAFVILDEAQNTTPVQMKMFLTRLGHNSKMVINGDLTQIDLGNGCVSGLQDAIDTLGDINELAVVTLTEADIVRHPLVAKIVSAYSNRLVRKK